MPRIPAPLRNWTAPVLSAATFAAGLSLLPLLVPNTGRTQTAPPRSIWDGVYTMQQAKRGEALYADNCSRCHGDELEGDEAPALETEELFKDWKGYTLADLYKRVRDSMPYDSPGILTPSQSADALAYVLNRNRLPAGQQPMSTDLNILRQTRIDK